MTTTKLIPSTDLKNTKRAGLGLELLDSTAGDFVVLEECSHSAPYEIGRFKHDGSAVSRATAFSNAQTLAGNRDKFDGQGFSFNIYEEEAAAVEPHAAALAAMSYADVETVSMVASTVRHDLRKKDISLRSLRAIDASRPRYNPYDSGAFRMTKAVWELVLTVIGTRIDDTCKELIALEYAADRENQRRDTPVEAPLSVGDRINDGGIIRHVTTVRPGGAIVVVDDLIELTATNVQRVETCQQVCGRIATACGITPDHAFQAFSGAYFDEAAAIAAVKRTQGIYRATNKSCEEINRIAAEIDQHASAPAAGEPAADIYRKTWPEVVEAMKVERAQPCGSKPHARAFLALMIERDQIHLPPYRDAACDVLKTHLVNCYQHGVLDPREFTQAEQLATDTQRPGDLLKALHAALLAGADIVEALQAAR